ncbi:MAG: electron transfer flavoprotein alpha subunit [Actinomycetota bacterium]|nr:electron transfer flavoprotein alpha subunit [Actinomycetota bacterium]
MATIWVYAEVDNGKLDPTALELVTKARDLGDVEAVALGPGATEAATALGEHGAEIVYASDDQVYADYVAQPHVHALAELIGENAPDVIMFATNYDSRDIAGRLSARIGATLMSNVMALDSVDVAKTAIFGGSLVVDVALEGATKLILVRPKSFGAEPNGGEATVVPVEVDIPEDAKKVKRVERHEEQASGPKLEEAPVVISGGRGLQDPSNFDLLDQLAAALGNTAVGATRAVVDAGWVPYAYQIGQTGKTVKPSIYIAFGVSGATQHVVGMKGAKRIIAINKDEEAPIFQLADLGIVGDALKILPQLIEEVKSRKG